MFECDIAHRRSGQYYVCCTRSGATRCTVFTVLYIGRIFRCGLHAVIWLHFGTLMLLFAEESLSTAWLSFACQYLCGTILVIPYTMVLDLRVSRTRPIPLYLPSCTLHFGLRPFYLSLFHFIFFYSQCCGAEVFLLNRESSSDWIAHSQPCIAKLFQLW